MRKDSIRNPKGRPLSTPDRLGLLLAIVACAAGMGYCASKNKGHAVMVTTNPGSVRGCSFLGRVTGTGGEDGPVNTGGMSLRAGDMGANVLLVLPAGAGEAWYCDQKTIGIGTAANPTPVKPVVGLAPTPAATPRT